MKKILFACAGHQLNDERVTYKEACSLARLGYRVIVCGIAVPGFHEESLRLIDVDTLKDNADTSVNAKNGGRFKRMLRLKNIRTLIIRERPDLVVAHEFETAFLAWTMRRRFRYVFDVHECYEQTMHLIFPRMFQAVARGLLWRLYKSIIRGSCGLTVATPGCAAYSYALELGLPCVVLHNSPILTYFPFRDEEAAIPIIVHDGNLTFERGALEILDAVSMLKEKHKFRLMLLGSIPAVVKVHVERKIEELELREFVDMRGRLPWTEFGAVEASGQIGLICSQPVPNHMLGLPNKLYNYMACGLAVLAMKGSTCGELVEACKCGILAEPADAKSIATALEWLIEHPEDRREMALNGRKAVEEQYCWERMESTMKDFYGRMFVQAAV